MSSRRKANVDNPLEQYETPAWCVRLLLDHVPLPPRYWVEPAAGNGAIIRAVNAIRSEVLFHAIELDPKYTPDLVECADSYLIGDATQRSTWNTVHGQQVAITNPPFSRAQEMAEVAMERVEHVVFLLRLNFLGSAARAYWLRATQPDVYVISAPRPRFDKTKKGTDSIEYAWFHWHESSAGRLVVLPPVPKEER